MAGTDQYAISSSQRIYVGHGGGLTGGVGISAMSYNRNTVAFGGTQAEGGNGGGNTSVTRKLPYKGRFGQGGAGTECASGGGGGFYGGGGGYGYSSTISTGTTSYYYGKGAGGSGYFSTRISNGCMYTYSTLNASTDAATKTVSTANVSETPTSEYAKQGNGYARITLIE